MAADLTPRFRRISSRSDCRLQRGRWRRGYSGPFQATQLWNSIIQTLRTQVEVKRRRQHLRTYSNCFTGSDAVDVVLSHLMQNIYLSSSDISRLQGVQLCQALMDHNVFEPVGAKLFRSEREMVFEDTNNSLYRFLNCSLSPVLPKRRDTKNFSPSERRGMKANKLSRTENAITISNPLALEIGNKSVKELLQTISLHPSLPPDIAFNVPSHQLSRKVVDDIWKQQILVRLLQLIHLPILENILESPSKTDQRKKVIREDDLVVSNTFVEREVTQCLNLPELDRWLCAAVDCLEYFPDQDIVMLSQQLPQNTKDKTEVDAHKKMLFDVLAKHYNQEREPFLHSHYLDIHLGIIELLESGKHAHTLEALQLYIRLLAPNAREELRRLLTFMAVAAEPQGYKLQKQFENKLVLIKAFTTAIVQNKALSKTQREQLIQFLMENASELFQTPLTLLELVSTKLRSLQNGKDPDAISGFTFCQPLTCQEFEEQRKQTTQQLQWLVHEIGTHPTLPVKQKRKLLKEFQKHHSVAWTEHF
ncbi:DEP domain-containing protein 4 [Rhinatrema bivittatum]|uniref:DEP domain-containing protein 4 n=1 Tax=Rhinatrema bivittatum TaxID=194408 RepID=UPI00112BF7B3|nr:DEP domain-containing protein 4 [Rhinatrema bivittatum]XP_029455598.1 DEP domain-containing protein 4 [Rhinatrema bivittatum]XP_029455599.1 DEP domain-containing protein 4 [Rhinatrema bivittatum]